MQSQALGILSAVSGSPYFNLLEGAMASLIESLTQSLTPDLVGQIGKSAGLDNSLVNKGLGVVGPLVTGALANTSQSPLGMDSLMKLMPQSGGSSGIGNLVSMITGGGASSSMLSGLFGPGLSAITGTLERSLGFKVAPLIGMAAPLVMNLVGQTMKARNLDKAGVAQMLQEEHKQFVSSGSEASKLVMKALDAGKDAAVAKARYSADQWTKVRLAPSVVAKAVMDASPSGAIGRSKELAAVASTITESRNTASPTSLVNLAFDVDLTASETNLLKQSPNLPVSVIRDAVVAVSTNSPGDASEYGRLLVNVATRVAEASKEGGFLGIGGTRVSENEQKTINEIRAMVGIAA
jgi:hypothetical protein